MKYNWFTMGNGYYDGATDLDEYLMVLSLYTLSEAGLV